MPAKNPLFENDHRSRKVDHARVPRSFDPCLNGPAKPHAQVYARQYCQCLSASFAQLLSLLRSRPEDLFLGSRGLSDPRAVERAVELLDALPGIGVEVPNDCPLPSPAAVIAGVSGAQRRRPFRFGRPRGPKQRKRKELFAKRNQTFRHAGRKSLRALGVRNQSFRLIVCFQWVNRLFVSRSRRTRSLDPKKPAWERQKNQLASQPMCKTSQPSLLSPCQRRRNSASIGRRAKRDLQLAAWQTRGALQYFYLQKG